MKLADFDYELPDEYIAQHPVSPRDHAKLMVLDREKHFIDHKFFYNINELLKSNDVLVLNSSRVIPARLFGKKKQAEGEGVRTEILLLKRLDDSRWEALMKPGKRFKAGDIVVFHSDRDASYSLEAQVEGRNDNIFTLNFNVSGAELMSAIHIYGTIPLPPYIHEKSDPNEYQTVYAEKEGSVAAPTAGLHFTPELIENLKKKGVVFETVDLHVGLGTFLPVSSDDIEKHMMHSEYFEISEETADRLNRYKKEGRRIIAVGTTSIRVLESCVQSDGLLKGMSGETKIFIYPGYRFKCIDGMITNFHLPKSTLLMLVSAFAGREFILEAYELAKKNDYRFFSFGDAMLVT
jgi:S-adenosylmethionine:tRNA ribosyltransferase-isomerase